MQGFVVSFDSKNPLKVKFNINYFEINFQKTEKILIIEEFTYA